MTKENFDINSFQREVLSEIDNIKREENRNNLLISILVWLTIHLSFSHFIFIEKPKKVKQVEKKS